jgi:hypothetical protein
MHTNTSAHETINSSVHEGDRAARRMRNCTSCGSRSRSSTSRPTCSTSSAWPEPRTRVPRARSRRRARRPTVDTPPPLFDEPLNAGRYSMLKMPHIYPVEGGIPVIVDGQRVGAIGVASVLPHLDAAVADAGRKRSTALTWRWRQRGA